jgi:hypothetical protein
MSDLKLEKDQTPPAPRLIEVSPTSEAIGGAVLSTPGTGVLLGNHDQSKPVPNSPAKKVAEDCRRMAFQTAKGQNEARVTVTGGSMFALTNTLLSAGNLLEALARSDPGAPAPEGFRRTVGCHPDGRAYVTFEQIEAPAPEAPKERVQPTRETALKFAGLPYATGWVIAADLGLIKVGERFPDDGQFHQAVLRRATEAGKVEQLRKKVNESPSAND